jgi:hypothetical protein
LQGRDDPQEYDPRYLPLDGPDEDDALALLSVKSAGAT